jgi:hypothetical protein
VKNGVVTAERIRVTEQSFVTALELRSGAVVQFELANEKDDGSCEGEQDCNRRGGLCIMNGGDVTANMSSEGSLLYCTSKPNPVLVKIEPIQ